MVEGLGFRVEGSGIMEKTAETTIWVFGFAVKGWCWAQASGLRA